VLAYANVGGLKVQQCLELWSWVIYMM